ncbi:MAG TPA: HPF/RaiA family ribosome-associated protein [Spirochaetia bacterium]|nr:HPF/RaiA family ribosome-associated protein [Spirochaetia bacterium]
MRIHVRAVNLALDGETRARVERRLQASLGRLAHRILRVGVRIVDENGPRGGADMACLVEVRLRRAERVFVEATDLSLDEAVKEASEKVATAVVRALERSRESRRRSPADHHPADPLYT